MILLISICQDAHCPNSYGLCLGDYITCALLCSLWSDSSVYNFELNALDFDSLDIDSVVYLFIMHCTCSNAFVEKICYLLNTVAFRPFLEFDPLFCFG